MKTLFLAQYELRTSHYMGETTTEDRMRLVWANTAEEADKMIEDEYEAQGSDYGTSYRARVRSTTAALGSPL